jgi:tripartite ATP-independent transporter DctM subunit
MVIYALAAGRVSIGGLFLAGAIPGFLLGAGLLVISYLHARKGEYTWIRGKMKLGDLVRATIKVIPLLLLPLIIVGGIVSGVFTVTESAAVGVAYVLAVGFLITRLLRLRHIYEAVVYSAEMSSVLALLLSAGAIVSWILTRNQATAQLTEFLAAISQDPLFFLFVIAGALVLLGMVMDATAIIIALAPVLAPIAVSYGVSSLQFGLVFVMTVMIGLITPPVGIVLFLTSSISGVPVEGISRAIIPFVLWEICVVILAILIPGVSLWLPGVFGFF